jgi:beta-lactamase superfamily II metal-dependent hydrolase
VDRPLDARRRPRIKGAFVRGRALLALFAALFVLAVPTGCELLSIGAARPPSGALVVSFIDVGQGDAVLIQSGG